jgi:hypothetical protein
VRIAHLEDPGENRELAHEAVQQRQPIDESMMIMK